MAGLVPDGGVDQGTTTRGCGVQTNVKAAIVFSIDFCCYRSTHFL
jgi:hypothetical protein